MNDYPGATVAKPADIYPPRNGKPTYMQKVAAWEQGADGQPVLSDKAIGSEVGDDPARDRGRTLSSGLVNTIKPFAPWMRELAKS